MPSPQIFSPWLIRLATGAAVIAAPRMLAQNPPIPSPSTRSAAGYAAGYRAEQAERGKSAFAAVCVECHTRSDMSSDDFRLKWNGRTALDLYDRIRTSMPDNNPGSRSVEEYTDLVAYMMQLNGVIADSVALTPDSTMSQIKLELRPPAGD